MSRLAIKAENISKQYRLGKVGTGTLSHDLNRLWYKVRGLEDPYIKIGEANDRSVKGESDYVWSLRDINFEIEQGDSVGIIGRNGAGKSTLLKLLSKVTKPTTGGFKVNGRIASLLEVGTGFNPEMTGRENIYLNGAILGMRRAEITRKLDEIIAFSGVERYIDTPVKRYSSGMYVRLAFAVAAHLESEILIVDEVLAVGDAEFQKKCLGKMGDVSKGEGRTVLFVSHNMAAIQNLCSNVIYLENGKLIKQGITPDVINLYLSKQNTNYAKLSDIKVREGNGQLVFTNAVIQGVKTNLLNSVETFSDVSFKLEYQLNISSEIKNYRIDIGINNFLGDRVAWLSSQNTHNNFNINCSNFLEFIIENNPLAPGDYTCNIFCEINNEISDWLVNVLPFTIIEKDYYGTGKLMPKNQGNILLNYKIK
jgi:lipopolysaccharide transport system ATP-binding protein